MPKTSYVEKLILAGFSHVERDDRLLDVFRAETPDKGVELWEKWNDTSVELIRLHNGKEFLYTFSRKAIEEALRTHQSLSLQ